MLIMPHFLPFSLALSVRYRFSRLLDHVVRKLKVGVADARLAHLGTRRGQNRRPHQVGDMRPRDKKANREKDVRLNHRNKPRLCNRGPHKRLNNHPIQRIVLKQVMVERLLERLGKINVETATCKADIATLFARNALEVVFGVPIRPVIFNVDAATRAKGVGVLLVAPPRDVLSRYGTAHRARDHSCASSNE